MEVIMCDLWWMVLYINCVLCYWKKKDWVSVKRDCEMVLYFEWNSVKVLYMFGLVLIVEKKFMDVVKLL